MSDTEPCKSNQLRAQKRKREEGDTDVGQLGKVTTFNLYYTPVTDVSQLGEVTAFDLSHTPVTEQEDPERKDEKELENKDGCCNPAPENASPLTKKQKTDEKNTEGKDDDDDSQTKVVEEEQQQQQDQATCSDSSNEESVCGAGGDVLVLAMKDYGTLWAPMPKGPSDDDGDNKVQVVVFPRWLAEAKKVTAIWRELYDAAPGYSSENPLPFYENKEGFEKEQRTDGQTGLFNKVAEVLGICFMPADEVDKTITWSDFVEDWKKNDEDKCLELPPLDQEKCPKIKEEDLESYIKTNCREFDTKRILYFNTTE